MGGMGEGSSRALKVIGRQPGACWLIASFLLLSIASCLLPIFVAYCLFSNHSLRPHLIRYPFAFVA